MIKNISCSMAILLTVIFSGCGVSLSPHQGDVFVYPGATQTFTVTASPAASDIVWLLDDEEVQAGGTSFDYTAPDDAIISQSLTLNLTAAVGLETYTWNITNDLAEAPGSPNNPHIPAGPGPWFEGWYTRVSDDGGSRSIAIIGASSLPQGEYFTPGQYLPGYINVLVSEGDGAPTYSYTVYPEQTMTLVDGVPVSQNPVPYSVADFEWVAEGFGTITEDSVNISIPGVIDVNIQTTNRLPFNIYSPETGPYGALDAFPLPLRWWIHSFGSDAQYQYTIHDGGGAGSFSGTGYTHLEKNWGAGFPIGWIWTQGIATGNQSQFVMSTAEVDMGFFILNAWIASYRSPAVSWDYIFSMPAATFYTERDACAGTFLFEITDSNLDRQLIFDASAPPNTFGAVSTPSEDGFEPETGVESFCATVNVSAYEGGTLLDTRQFHNAALEFGTGYTCQE